MPIKISNATLVGCVLLIWLGGTVIFGWLTHNHALIQISPTLVPMVFNTALCFVLTGLGILAINKSPNGSFVIGMLICLFGIMTLSENIFNLNLGIDEAIIKAYLKVNTLHAGRVAPNAALSFMLIGITLMLYRLNNHFIDLFIFGICLVITSIGLTAVVGHIFGINTAYGWDEWGEMAIHTAVGVIIAGLTLLSITSLSANKTGKEYRFLPLEIFLFLFISVLFLSQSLVKYEHQRMLNIISGYLTQNSQEFLQTLKRNDLAIQRMQKRITNMPNMKNDLWQEDAKAYLNDTPSLNSLGLVSKTKSILSAAISDDITYTDSYKELQSCVSQLPNKPDNLLLFMMSPKSSILCVPYYVGMQSQTQYLMATIDLNRFARYFETNTLINGYGIEIRVNNQIVFDSENNSAELKNAWGVKVQFHYKNINFEIDGWPNQDLISKFKSNSPLSTLLIGLVFSILFSISIWSIMLMIRSKNHIAQSEARAIKLKNQLQSMINSSRMSIIATDMDGTITSFNHAAEKILEYKAQEVVGIANPSIFHDRAEIINRANFLSKKLGCKITPDFQVFIADLKNQDYDEQEWTYISKSGKRISVLLSVTALRDSNNHIYGYLGIALDISERKAIEHLKNEFIAMVSHELRTPLTSIHGSIVLLIENMGGTQSEESQSLLNIALNNTERLIRLINDILDLEKMEAGKMEFVYKPYPVDPLIKEAINANKAFADKFSVTIKPYQPLAFETTIMVDHDRLIQVLTNLISNAIKFSPKDSSIEVTTKINANYLKISVTDKGKGIPVEFQRTIFQKFSQADSSDVRAKQGTGLGLNISKLIIETMGGSISFKTEQNVGTTFIVEIPLKNLDDNPILINHLSSMKKILHIEDDSDLNKLVESIFKNDYIIVHAMTLSSARKLLSETTFQVVILDLQLEEGSALSLIYEIHKQKIPIIVLTAYDLPAEYTQFVSKVLIKSKTSNIKIKEAVNEVLTQPINKD